MSAEAPHTSQQIEIELARRLLAGDMEAFEQFVDLFRSKLFQYTFLVCGQRDDAEEVAQETLMKVFEKLDQLREPERVRPWVLRIARNECLMKRRKSVYAPARELSLDEFLPAWQQNGGERKLDIADWSAVPSDELLRAEMRKVLHQAIAALPELYRPVILLRDIEELSTEETAQILDLSTDAVKQRLHRARLAVRRTLDEYLKSPGIRRE